MVEEVWKDIPGFEGCYQVSNLARVRSVDRKMWIESSSRKSYERVLKGTILKPRRSPWGWQVYLYKNFDRRPYSLRRLVAEAFLENPLKYKDLIFLDGDKFNPVATNLKWESRSEVVKNSWSNRSRKR